MFASHGRRTSSGRWRKPQMRFPLALEHDSDRSRRVAHVGGRQPFESLPGRVLVLLRPDEISGSRSRVSRDSQLYLHLPDAARRYRNAAAAIEAPSPSGLFACLRAPAATPCQGTSARAQPGRHYSPPSSGSARSLPLPVYAGAPPPPTAAANSRRGGPPGRPAPPQSNSRT